MVWNIENYYIIDGRILRVEISVPLLEFLYTKIDDVKQAWLDMLSQVVSEQPGFDVSWEMQPREDQAVVTIQIAKPGNLGEFTKEETTGAIDAVDALFDDKKDSIKF
jgi:hypothetical protein